LKSLFHERVAEFKNIALTRKTTTAEDANDLANDLSVSFIPIQQQLMKAQKLVQLVFIRDFICDIVVTEAVSDLVTSAWNYYC
jgi:hypothetical protein